MHQEIAGKLPIYTPLSPRLLLNGLLIDGLNGLDRIGLIGGRNARGHKPSRAPCTEHRTADERLTPTLWTLHPN